MSADLLTSMRATPKQFSLPKEKSAMSTSLCHVNQRVKMPVLIERSCWSDSVSSIFVWWAISEKYPMKSFLYLNSADWPGPRQLSECLRLFTASVQRSVFSVHREAHTWHMYCHSYSRSCSVSRLKLFRFDGHQWTSNQPSGYPSMCSSHLQFINLKLIKHCQWHNHMQTCWFGIQRTFWKIIFVRFWFFPCIFFENSYHISRIR